MYTYLNQRYGLKPLILDWASAIIAGIQRHSRFCADVCLFGKVLRNEVDEDFRFVQAALRETAGQLLRVGVRERYPQKGESEVKGMVEDIYAERAHVETHQWLKIIERMYDQQDIKVLEEKIKENAKTRLRSEIAKKLNRKALSPQHSQGKLSQRGATTAQSGH